MSKAAQTYYTFVGERFPDSSGGIYRCIFSEKDNKFLKEGQLDCLPMVSYVSMDNSGMYACCAGSSRKGSILHAYRINQKQKQMSLSDSKDLSVSGISHVNFDSKGDRLLATSYADGYVLVYDFKDGKIGNLLGLEKTSGRSINPDRQEASHPHSVFASPDDRFLVVSDLGADKLLVFALKDDGSLKKVTGWNAPAGSGPRHFEFHSNNGMGYLLTELSSQIFTFSVGQDKLLKRQVERTISESFKDENLAAEIRLSKDLKYLYVSNRGENSIVQYGVDVTGTITRLNRVSTRGWPREIELSSDGRYLFVLNEEYADSIGEIEAFQIEHHSGRLISCDAFHRVPMAYTFILL